MLLFLNAAEGQGLTASTLCHIEPVGRWFKVFKRRNRNASASFQELEEKTELSEESEDEELQLQEFPMLKTLDPKDWKTQDHYAVLGLGNVRYKATQRQIKATFFLVIIS
uniref:DnaJ heat shock protein family (Hsp40) member C2 n=1 Tax=Rhinolophus ferrumequinum TaxID=59479 RepID=A0A671EHM4_RHIFE